MAKYRRAVILVVSCVILAVLLVLAGTFFHISLNEKRFSDTEKYNVQALSLADAGVSHGLAELRKRIRADLNVNLSAVTFSSDISGYVIDGDSLGFLRDYAYPTGGTQFSVSSNQATLALPNFELNTQVRGSYSTTVIVTENGESYQDGSSEIYIFPYKYVVKSLASITAVTPNIQKRVQFSNGQFVITVRRDNFARYALFTNHHRTTSGVPVWFTNNTNFTGPVSTNDRFSFALNPSGAFSEEVTQHLTKARFYNNGSPKLLDADSNPPRDVPTFQNGFSRGVDLINLESAITKDDLKSQALGGFSGGSYPNGIYVPNNGSSVTGGIYIKGDSTIGMSLDTNNNAVYTITQGSTTNTITVDYTNSQTIVDTGSSTETYSGLPDGTDDEGVIVYSDDKITSLSGTIQRQSEVTISGEEDVIITNNIVYQDYSASPTLNATGFTNILGILSWGGNVRIGASAPNNVNIHATVMAPHGVFTVDNYNSGSPRGTATLLGGVITDFYGPFGTFAGGAPISGYGRNFVYDGRMLTGSSPPYFPTLSYFRSYDDGGLDRRPLWQEKGE